MFGVTINSAHYWKGLSRRSDHGENDEVEHALVRLKPSPLDTGGGCASSSQGAGEEAQIAFVRVRLPIFKNGDLRSPIPVQDGLTPVRLVGQGPSGHRAVIQQVFEVHAHRALDRL